MVDQNQEIHAQGTLSIEDYHRICNELDKLIPEDLANATKEELDTFIKAKRDLYNTMLANSVPQEFCIDFDKYIVKRWNSATTTLLASLKRVLIKKGLSIIDNNRRLQQIG